MCLLEETIRLSFPRLNQQPSWQPEADEITAILSAGSTMIVGGTFFVQQRQEAIQQRSTGGGHLAAPEEGPTLTLTPVAAPSPEEALAVQGALRSLERFLLSDDAVQIISRRGVSNEENTAGS